MRPLPFVHSVTLTLGLFCACENTTGPSTFADPLPPPVATEEYRTEPLLGSVTDPLDGGAEGGALDRDSACATNAAQADRVPVSLVFMFDKSGSMGQWNISPADRGDNTATRWAPCRSALKNFFADPRSTGVHASLQYFPLRSGSEAACVASEYAVPAVPMRPLPDTTTFAQSIDAITPEGSTPSSPAMLGAVQYAKTIQSAHINGAKTAIVLVTDGEPYGCSQSNNTPAAVATLASDALRVDGIRTYVIGVGDDVLLQNLDAIAASGGTTSALRVNTAKTSSDFLQALGKIRGDSLSCDLSIPAPKAGEKLDYGKVNVLYRNGSTGVETVLTYNHECAGGSGWRYDSEQTPTRVQLCASTCEEVKADDAARFEVLFGCQTRPTLPR